MFVKACLNGYWSRADHPRLPATPDQLAKEAVAAVHAGAVALHVHAKDDAERDTLGDAEVSAALRAIRDAAPGVPVGVTTHSAATPSPDDRLAAVRGWTALPDFASVNWQEAGSEELADLLLQRGIGVEACVRDVESIDRWRRWPRGAECTRVLLEVLAVAPDGDALADGRALVERLGESELPVLLHGRSSWCWPVFAQAVELGLGSRIGLEDTSTMPDGAPAAGNADLVAAAMRMAEAYSSPGGALLPDR